MIQPDFRRSFAIAQFCFEKALITTIPLGLEAALSSVFPIPAVMQTPVKAVKMINLATTILVGAVGAAYLAKGTFEYLRRYPFLLA